MRFPKMYFLSRRRSSIRSENGCVEHKLQFTVQLLEVENPFRPVKIDLVDIFKIAWALACDHRPVLWRTLGTA